jgi:hypothetical protein
MTNTGLPDPGIGKNPPRYEKYQIYMQRRSLRMIAAAVAALWSIKPTGILLTDASKVTDTIPRR